MEGFSCHGMFAALRSPRGWRRLVIPWVFESLGIFFVSFVNVSGKPQLFLFCATEILVTWKGYYPKFKFCLEPRLLYLRSAVN